jgi:hypothetical protein
MQDDLRYKIYDMRKTSDAVDRTRKAVEDLGKGINHLVIRAGIVTGDSEDLVW